MWAVEMVHYYLNLRRADMRLRVRCTKAVDSPRPQYSFNFLEMIDGVFDMLGHPV